MLKLIRTNSQCQQSLAKKRLLNSPPKFMVVNTHSDSNLNDLKQAGRQ